MSDTELTEGAVIVAALVKRLGASKMGRKLELSEGGVRAHASGAAVPRAGVRARYLAAYDVPVTAWDTQAPSAAPTVPVNALAPASTPSGPSPSTNAAPNVPPAPAGHPDALAAVVHLLETARRQLEAAEADRDAPYQARAQLITSATGLCRLLARLSGQLEITQAAIVRSSAWRKILVAFAAVATRHPEAERAFAELGAALQELGE